VRERAYPCFSSVKFQARRPTKAAVLREDCDRHRQWQASAESLDVAIASGLPGAPFVRNAARRLAIAAYRAGDRLRTQHAIDALRGPGMTQTDQLLALDWEQRLELDTTKRLSKSLPK
jgi:hypothetical protein